MIYRLLADLTVLLHAGFVLFVIGGGLLVLWRRRVAWLHLPAALYGAAIELFGWTCPLTPLEVRFRRAAGRAGYAGGFIDHYVTDLLYLPAPVWEEVRVWLGLLVLAANAAIYAWVWRRLRRGRRGGGERPGGA